MKIYKLISMLGICCISSAGLSAEQASSYFDWVTKQNVDMSSLVLTEVDGHCEISFELEGLYSRRINLEVNDSLELAGAADFGSCQFSADNLASCDIHFIQNSGALAKIKNWGLDPFVSAEINRAVCQSQIDQTTVLAVDVSPVGLFAGCDPDGELRLDAEESKKLQACQK